MTSTDPSSTLRIMGYAAACLTFQSASTPPDITVPPGTLIWNNVGPIAPGGMWGLGVSFEAAAGCGPTDNTITASGVDEFSQVVPGVSATETVTINNPQVAVGKTRISPAGGSATVGDTVAYRISITNTGDTDIVELSLFDDYSASCLTFQSARACAAAMSISVVMDSAAASRAPRKMPG